MGRLNLDFNGLGDFPRPGKARSHSDGGTGNVGPTWTVLERLKEACGMAEWIKVGLPVLAAILSAYVMIQGHDIKINRLEVDMKAHLEEHKKEAKDASDKLSRIELAVERIEARMEANRSR